jgi:acyl carrier protein
MKTEHETREALRRWITDASKRAEQPLITDSTPIIEERIITSLQVMDLILYIEKLRGRRVEMDDLRPGVFNNIDAIYASFFAGVAA